MRGVGVLCLVAVLLLPGCSFRDEPAPEGGGAYDPARFEFKQGDAWTYEVTDKGARSTLRSAFDGARDRDGTRVLVFRVSETKPGELESPGRVDEVAADTLAVVETRQVYPRFSFAYEPPYSVVWPAADHAYAGRVVVTTDFGAQFMDMTSNVTYVGVERVSVPAGTFDAHHFTAVSHVSEQGERTTDVWFSADVRMPVKTVTGERTEALSNVERG